MSDKNAVEEMSRKEKAIQELITEAKAFADLHGLQFDTGIDELELNATYYGVGHEDREEYGEYEGWASSFL